MNETQVRFLDWEDPLEEGMATHSSILAWRTPMDKGAWQATVHGVTKSPWGCKESMGLQITPLFLCCLIYSGNVTYLGHSLIL